MLRNENKQLKIILNNENPLVRFHLLQLWVIDVYTKSLSNSSEGLNSLICEVCAPKNSDTIEDTFNKITKLKTYIVDYNNKLKATNEELNHVKTYQKIIKHLLNKDEQDNTEGAESDNGITQIIETNEKLINAIDKLSINELKQIITQ